MRVLLGVTLLNYAVQIPYYLQQYYARGHLAPSILGTLMLALTLAWFLAGYLGFGSKNRWANPTLVAFLLTEFVFYLQTQVSQLLTAHQVFLYVINPTNLVLFIVFGVGYINMFVALTYAIRLLRPKEQR